ncbi:glutathione S-transferase family protein [Frigidibacter mobilis]|uniref:Glutathione S-transferase, putative n=1 Tax=Frigidibacter mobilis TaxID=1335048 RepID=A0A159Z3D4_9RHOB|nr:glutathione S-transferase [Frigidibacter mobilis]AMY69575.1 glutathione S-transferase, putative [Frigidibacter mobilis]
MIRLHHVAQTRSFRVLWMLEELGLEFELVPHSFFDRSLREPAYLALSPAGRVPALEIDGRCLSESGAILQYLAETRGALTGTAGERPDWLEWLHYAETVGSHVANLTQHHIILRDPSMRSPTVMRLEAKRLEKALEGVERRMAGDWLLASGFSAADIAVSYGALIGQRFTALDRLPRVAGWLERIAARPAFRRAAARDGAAAIYTQAFYPPPEETPHA